MLMYMYAWSISENFEWGVNIYWWGAVYMCMVSKCLHNKHLILSEKSNK